LNKPEILDTFPRFLQYWENVSSLGLEAKIEAWACEYLAEYPELLEMQLEDYREQGLSWQEIAAQRIFPYLQERLPVMEEARGNLLKLLPEIHHLTAQKLGFVFPVMYLIYVGIGCGAGWAAAYGGSPAVLFGLENIAELGWSNRKTLTGLMVHELSHLAHHNWRREAGLALDTGPWWQLYEEGFAQACEVLITGTWHETKGSASQNWLEACHENQPALAAEFLRRVDQGQDVRDFFGSWFEVAGIPQAGYFLGSEIIRPQIMQEGAKQAALLVDLESFFRPILERMAAE
jgi:hypothetical protein